MNEQPLAHIPFRLWDELTILSMSRWMRFVGVIKVVGSLSMLFVVLVALIFAGAEMRTGSPGLGRMGKLVGENIITFLSLGFFALVLAIAGTWLGFLLCQAAEDFERVVRTDVADQDHITVGLIRLKVYFKVSILLAIAAVVVGLTAGIALGIRAAAAP